MSKEKADISMLSGQNDQLSTDTVKWERSRVARSKKNSCSLLSATTDRPVSFYIIWVSHQTNL